VDLIADAVEYRRTFKNNTGKDITALAFKVINLTTLNSRPTLAVQEGDLRVVDASNLTLEVPAGSNNYVGTVGSYVDDTYPTSMYAFSYPAPDTGNCDGPCPIVPLPIGGMNTRLAVPLGSRLLGLQAEALSSFGSLAPAETLAVNFRAQVWGGGYYLWVVVPQISSDVRLAPR